MRKILTIILFFFISLPIFSQRENLDKILDEFLFGTDVSDSLLESISLNEIDLSDISSMYKYRFIYLRTEFENKTFFSGQDLGVNQYNLTGQVYYQGSRGLNIGIAGMRYNQFEPKYNTTIITAGYNNRVAEIKGLNIRALYSRYFFAKDSVRNSFNSSVDLGLTYQWKAIGTSADITELIGNKTSTQINWDLFADLPLKRFGLTNKLSFQPEVALYFGNETVVVSRYITLTWYTGEITSRKKTYGLMNTMVRLPLSLTFKNFDVSAGYNFNFPRIPGSANKIASTSFFNLSLGYIFGI